MAPVLETSELMMDRHRFVLARLYGGELDAARDDVERLRASSWRHPDFVDACRESGLSPERLKDRPGVR